MKVSISIKPVSKYFAHILQRCFREGRTIPKGLPVIMIKGNEPHETLFSFILLVI